MTTGNRTMNGRYYFPAPSGDFGLSTSPLLVGRYYTRTWSGANASTKYKGKKKPQSREPKQSVYPPNPYTCSWYEEERGVLRCNLKSDPNRVECTNVGGFSNPLPEMDAKQFYKLMEKLNRRVYGTAFHPALALAEADKALGMIHNAAVRIGASIHALKTKNSQLLRAALPWVDTRSIGLAVKHASSGVLAVQYGWRPLFGDAHNGAEWLAARLNNDHLGIGDSGRYHVTRNWNVVQSPVPFSNGPPWAQYSSEVTNFSLSLVIYVQSIDNMSLPNVYSAAEMLYERIPYSFVVDWFVPVGKYLAAMNMASRIKGTTVTSLKIERVGEGFVINPFYYTNGYQYVGDERLVEGTFTRTVSEGIQVPKPMNMPTAKGSLSYERTVNALALIGNKSWHLFPRLLGELPLAFASRHANR